MAETEAYMYGIMTGVFIFLAGLLFALRAKRPHGPQTANAPAS